MENKRWASSWLDRPQKFRPQSKSKVMIASEAGSPDGRQQGGADGLGPPLDGRRDRKTQPSGGRRASRCGNEAPRKRGDEMTKEGQPYSHTRQNKSKRQPMRKESQSRNEVKWDGPEKRLL
jgi:hypothetical protein